jgi:hypothetical protein
MNDSAKLTWKNWAVYGIAGGVAGFCVGYFLKGPYTKARLRYGFDPTHAIHHGEVGTTIAVLGQLAGQTIARPICTGFGLGLVVDDFVGHFAPQLVPQPSFEAFKPEDAVDVEMYGDDVPAQDVEVDENGNDVWDAFNPSSYKTEEVTQSIVQLTEVEPDAQPLPTKTWKEIADWPPKLRSAQMTSIIRKIILEDAHDPRVRSIAEDVILGVGMNGHNHEAVARVFSEWVKENVTYINDEASGPHGESTDRYQHSWVTAPPSPQNPTGRGCGDCASMVILHLAMCQSVGIDEVCGLLVDQGRGYSHLMSAFIPGGRTPKSIDDVIGIELTEPKKFGWLPPAKKFGFLIL